MLCPTEQKQWPPITTTTVVTRWSCDPVMVISVSSQYRHALHLYSNCSHPNPTPTLQLVLVIYLLRLGSIFCKYNINIHCYADDIQLYLNKPTSNLPTSFLTDCISGIKILVLLKISQIELWQNRFSSLFLKSTLEKKRQFLFNIDRPTVFPWHSLRVWVSPLTVSFQLPSLFSYFQLF